METFISLFIHSFTYGTKLGEASSECWAWWKEWEGIKRGSAVILVLENSPHVGWWRLRSKNTRKSFIYSFNLWKLFGLLKAFMEKNAYKKISKEVVGTYEVRVWAQSLTTHNCIKSCVCVCVCVCRGWGVCLNTFLDIRIPPTTFPTASPQSQELCNHIQPGT